MKSIFYACRFRLHDDNKSARQRPRTAIALVKPNGRTDGGGAEGEGGNETRTTDEGREEGGEATCNRRHLARTSMPRSFALSKSTDGPPSCGPISECEC